MTSVSSACDPLALSDAGESVHAIESTPLRRLVHHRDAVAHDLPLEDLHRFYSERATDFAALVREGRVVGICDRTQLGSLLGSRFGFALNARSPAHAAGVKRPLVFPENTGLREVLQATLGRHDDEFYEDVALVHADHSLIGLIPVEALVRLQSRLVQAQMAEMRNQHEMLQRQNLELFQAGHALRQAQALSAGLFASNVIGAALLSAAGRVQTCNPRFRDLLGLDAEATEGYGMETLLSEGDQRSWADLLRALEQGSQTDGAREFELELPGRGRRVLRFSTGWIRETSQVCVCVDDITQQREMERHLRREEKQKLLDTLAGGVAHELNNKLTPVLGYAELLAQETSGPGVEFVGFIRKGVQESANIIRQLLHLSKPEGGRHDPLDLREVIAEAVSMLRFQVREARARIEVDTGPEGLLINGDGPQLKQVILNLAINALHAMEQTPDAVLRIRAGRGASGIFFEVEDNGSGIPSEIVGRIFDPFFTTKGPDKGTGLGLSVCQGIVRQHGGQIEVESVRGRGTRFRVGLPALDVGKLLFRDSPKDTASDGQGGLRGRRVLVVEDETVIRNFLLEAVRHLYGCTVDAAADGREGLDHVNRHDYDLILSDIRMPTMTGPEFYLRLRDCCPAEAEKVVFVTGHLGPDQLQEDIARWGVPLLAKPFTIDRLSRICATRMSKATEGAA